MKAVKLKMWIGNLDGSRQGLVIAPSKTRALKIIGTSRSDFDAYWRQVDLDPSLEPEVLYTRAGFAGNPLPPWQRGRCPLPKKARSS